MWTLVGDDLTPVYVATYTGPSVSEITENGENMGKALGIDVIQPGEYFIDPDFSLIYVMTKNGLHPDQNAYMLYAWVGFTNRQNENSHIGFPIQGGDNVFYYPVLDGESVPPLNQSVTGLFTGQINTQFGSIRIADPEWIYENLYNFIFQNSPIQIKVGDVGSNYEEYVPVFTGVIGDQSVEQGKMTLSIVDVRQNIFSTIPPGRLLKMDYFDLPEQSHYVTKPILIGEKKGIVPAWVDEKKHRYLISQTRFSLSDQDFHFPLEEVSAVYKDGTLLTLGADYSVSLDEGEISLSQSAGESIITVDSKGIRISYDFDLLEFTGQYSENLAEYLFFCLYLLQSILISGIDIDSLINLKATTSAAVGEYLDAEVPFETYLKDLQVTGRFHLNTTATGQLTAVKVMSSSSPDEYFDDADMSKVVIKRTISGMASRVLVRYDRTPVRAETQEVDEGGGRLFNYKHMSVDTPSVEYKYKLKKRSQFDCIVTQQADALVIAQDFAGMLNRMQETLSFNMDYRGFTLSPLQKVAISHEVSLNGNPTAVYEKTPFVITSLNKNFGKGTVAVTAYRDIAQVRGRVLLMPNGKALLMPNGRALLT